MVGGGAMAVRLWTKVPGPQSLALMKDRINYVARGPFHLSPIFVKRAHGAIIEDVDGNCFLDFTSGIGVNNLGNCAPPIIQAMEEQARNFLHVSFNVAPYESYVRLCQRLAEKTPGSFQKKAFLANSGAEAVENACKIARCATGRQAIVAFNHGFHGRTYLGMALTSKGLYRQGFGPFSPEVYHAPYPYAYRWLTGSDPRRVSEECFREFEELIKVRLLSSQVAAVIFEPVLGEGGFVAMPKEFARMIRSFCTEHKILLIADEIQTGFGRTGSLFACEQLEIEPDLMTVAKGLAGGMPLSAVVGRADVMDAPSEGAIGGTFGGHPVSCAAALAVLDEFDKPNRLQQIRELGEKLHERVRSWVHRFEGIGEVRGLGPMLALEFVQDKHSKHPDPVSAKKLIRHCYERGVLILGAGSNGNVVRFLPPLTMSPSELNEGLNIIENSLKDIYG